MSESEEPPGGSTGSRTYDMDPPGPGPGSEPSPKPGPSSVSLRSDRSKDFPPGFREALPEDQREPGPQEQLDAIFTRLEEDVLMFVKEQLQSFHRLLEKPQRSSERSSETKEEQSSREAVLNITVDFLKRMKQEQLAELLKSCKNSVYTVHTLSSLTSEYTVLAQLRL